MLFCKKKKTNYGKIIAITVSAVVGAAAVAFVVYKLACKYSAQIAAVKVALLEKVEALKCRCMKNTDEEIVEDCICELDEEAEEVDVVIEEVAEEAQAE